MPPRDNFFVLNRATNVSRETYERLKLYQELLLKWQAKINLIGSDTVPEFWERHFMDSAQLLPLIQNSRSKIVDFGSGAGFPGMVLAILGCSDVHLVESDGKKIIFLKEVARITKTDIGIHHSRIESLHIADVEFFVSRACSSLTELLKYVSHYVSRETFCLFHKGKNYSQELLDSKNDWLFDYDVIPSITDPQGAILKIANLRKKP